MGSTNFRDLRVNQSLSIREISQITGIPKSTVSMKCRGLLPKNQKRLFDKIKINAQHSSNCNKEVWERKKKEIREQAVVDWESVRKDPILMVAVGLYWGEGKKFGGIRVTNNDPFVLSYCKSLFLWLNPKAKLVLTVFYYKDHDIRLCERYWQSLILIRPIMKPIHDKRAKHKPGKCPYGLGTLGFNDWKSEERLRTFVECARKGLLGDNGSTHPW